MSHTYLTTEELSSKIKYDVRTIRERLKDSVLLEGTHYGVRATEAQKRVLRLWIETGAAYPGTYAALGTGMIGGYAENQQVDLDVDWPETKAAAAVLERRCAGCHQEPGRLLPRSLSDERGLSFWQPSMSDPRLNTSRHIVFNLSRPEKSLILLAPLAKADGGWGLCRHPDSREAAQVFKDREDADYRVLLGWCEAGRNRLERGGRFDMPGFRPRPDWVREMKRYGVLDPGADPGAPMDVYAVERRYWESLWYRPPPVSATDRAAR